ncbi:hypothetical protein LguiB_005895 [Lonicera macranthoides]
MLMFYSIANNNITGTIPISICTASDVSVLDMSNNSLSGPIPLCLIKMSKTLGVLNLGKNRLSGNLSGTFKKNCRLQTLDLHDNQLEGKVPDSISNCTWLEWKAMMDDLEPEVKHLQFHLPGNFYYQDTMTVRNKGLEMDLVKILTVFTVIDFSMNNFDGNIPETIGELKSLYVLNLSRNALTGSIPSSLGNLKQLGSLDLSDLSLGHFSSAKDGVNGTGSTLIVLFCGLSIRKAKEAEIVKEKPTRNQFEDFSVRAYYSKWALIARFNFF